MKRKEPPMYTVFIDAWRGIITAFKAERNLRIHISAALAVVILSAWLNITIPEWSVLLLCTGFVISFELLNTSIETLSNLVEPNPHPAIKKVKDIAAGAVFVAAIISLIIGIIILCPYLYQKIAPFL